MALDKDFLMNSESVSKSNLYIFEDLVSSKQNLDSVRVA